MVEELPQDDQESVLRERAEFLRGAVLGSIDKRDRLRWDIELCVPVELGVPDDSDVLVDDFDRTPRPLPSRSTLLQQKTKLVGRHLSGCNASDHRGKSQRRLEHRSVRYFGSGRPAA